MKITAYALHDYAVTIQPSPGQRAWLEGEAEELSLGLGLATANGWDLLCPYSFEAVWQGGPRPEDIAISAPGFVHNRLGNGILTFETGYLFHIEEGHQVWARGPINYFKDGLQPLDLMLKTQGLPVTFSMPWKFTRPNQVVRFEQGEPFCTILPYPPDYIEKFEGEIKKIDDQPRIYAAFQKWERSKRQIFAGELPDQPGEEPNRLSSEDRQPGSQEAADRPAVSCVCLTYGRPGLLEEAIYSFLQQDYPGRKELIVLNDFDRHLLEFDHPEVRVINLARRFSTVAEKWNAAVALCAFDLIFVWHDDDIYLPQRLSWAVDRFDPQKGFLKPDQAWFWNDGLLSGPERNVFHGGSCWSRQLFDQAGGYPHMGNGYDQALETKFEQQRPGSARSYQIRPEEIYYIYRWNGTGSYHLSALGRDEPGQNREHDEVAAYVARQVQQGQVRSGRLSLKPQWQADYAGLVRDYLASHKIETVPVELTTPAPAGPPPIYFSVTPTRLSEAEVQGLFKGAYPLKLTVILPALNESAYLQRTVKQLRFNLPPDSEIIVVDNGSTDGCADFLTAAEANQADAWPAVRLMRVTEPLGVAGARNWGWKQARGEVVVFADAHVDTPPHWWQPLAATLNRPEVAMVGAAISAMGHPEVPVSYGQRVGGSNLQTKWLPKQQDSPYPVPTLGGGFVALRHDTLKATGGFDEGMLEWGSEDFELSLRLWLLGYEVWVAPEVEIAHYFRQQRPYGVDWVKLTHNVLRVAYLHFNQTRMARVLAATASYPEYAQALALCATSDVWARRAELAARRVRDDDWYFDHFKFLDCSA